MNKIELRFDKAQTCLAGFPYGKSVYEQQVEGKIDADGAVEIVFPSQIELVASSFVQGFFSVLVKQIGYLGIERNIKIVSASESLTQSICENLY